MFGESLPAERLRVGKHRDYLRESIKGIRIAVRENERKRIRECRADAQLSPQERIELVKVDRWVAYARADAVLTHLNSLLHYPPYDRMPCMLLYGLPGMGKTKILQKFLRDHPSSFDETQGVSRMNVIGIQMPPDADEKSIYEEVLGALDARIHYGHTTSQMRRTARRMTQLDSQIHITAPTGQLS